MSRYLEEAAQVLRKIDRDAVVHDNRMDVVKGFAMLATIDKGLLPAELTRDVIDSLLRNHT